MPSARRRLLAAISVAAAAVAPAAGQERAGAPTPRRAADLWFDPTQLPSFTGTVERYLPNPRGETDGLIFREGAQIVFPPDLADSVRRSVPVGRSIIVWGIRARTAPVITMLAFAPNVESTPAVVDRFYWRLSGRQLAERREAMQASGVVKQAYYAPQGEVAGAILEDGTVVLLPQGASEGFRDLLRPGQKIAAEGQGHAGEDGRALLAERLGDAPGNLRPVPATR